MLCYTSGTTGESKLVKLTHRNIITTALGVSQFIPVFADDVYLSYLPLSHSFEQALLCTALLHGCTIGYYSGNPAKLAEDCQVLKPTMFPGVPRLYNKLYQSIKAKMDAATGCKRWMIHNGFASKQVSATRGVYTSGCYDSLIFKKVKALLGGRVRIMITGSAPIDAVVLDYLRICFCWPILEGYGMAESSSAACFTRQGDPNAGHAGGPIKSMLIRLRDVPELRYLSTDKPYPRGEICMKGPSVTSGYFNN